MPLDPKSRTTAVQRTKEDMRPYQVRGAKFLLQKRYAALFVDMGLGKTIMVLSAIARLIRAGKIDRVLIVAPLRVCYAVWRQEAKLWAHTKSIKFSVVHGTHQAKVAALKKPAHIYLLNVDSLKWIDEVFGRRTPLPFDMLVVDESSMFKKVDTVRFRILRRRAINFKRRVVMTGTPTPNGLHEIWPQMYIVDRGYHLGRRYTDFKEDYFDKGGFMSKGLVAKEDSLQRIVSQTEPVVMRLDSADWLELPKLIEVPIWVDLPDAAREVYETLETEMFYAFSESGTFVDNPHAAALRNRCAQICGGAIYAEHEETTAKVWQPIHTAKLEACTEIIEELQGEPPIISYRFRHEAIRLKRMFTDMPLLGRGEGNKKPNEIEIMRLVEAWNARKLKGMIAHPASVGHGLNLQHGGRHFIWFSMTESLEQYLQMVKRLHRSGQTMSVINYLILARNTVDEVIYSNINFKLAQQQRTNNAYRDSTFARYMTGKQKGSYDNQISN